MTGMQNSSSVVAHTFCKGNGRKHQTQPIEHELEHQCNILSRPLDFVDQTRVLTQLSLGKKFIAQAPGKLTEAWRLQWTTGLLQSD